MREDFDPVMELQQIREGFLEDDRPGPADVVLELMRVWREQESELADLRVRVAELSPRPSKPSSAPRGRLSGRPSKPSPAAPGRTSDERRTTASDSRPPSRASELLLSEDLRNAPEVEGEEDLSAAAQDARANGRTSDSRPDNGRTNGSDERWTNESDEDADGALRALMAAAWDGIGGRHTSGTYKFKMGQLIPLLRKLAGEQGKEPIALWAESVARFKSDPGARRARLGLPVLLAQFDRWTYDAEPELTKPEPPRGAAYKVIAPPNANPGAPNG